MESNTNNNNDDLNLDFNQEIKDNNNFMSNDDEINFDLDENKENNDNNNKINNNIDNNNNEEEGNDDLNKAIHEDDDLEDEVEDTNFNLEEALKGNNYDNKKNKNDNNQNNINSINVIHDDDNINKINVIKDDDNINKINVIKDDDNINKINVIHDDDNINVIKNDNKNENDKNEEIKNENNKDEENKKNEINNNNNNNNNNNEINNNNNNEINNNNDNENEPNYNEHKSNNDKDNDNKNNDSDNNNNNNNNIINNEDKNIINNNNNDINKDNINNIENNNIINNDKKEEENNNSIEKEKKPEEPKENQKNENKEENFNILQNILNQNNNNNIINNNKESNINNPNSISSSINNNNNIIIDNPFKTTFQIQNFPFISQITIHKTQTSPETRAYISAVFSPSLSKIIVIGGTDKSCNQFSNLTIYDINTNTWETKDDPINFSKGISGHSSNLIYDNKNNEHLFIFGGYTSFTNVYTNHVFIVSLKTFNFNQIDFKKNFQNSEKYEYPLERSYHTSNYDREKQVIYVYGGTNMNFIDSKSENFNCIWEFNIGKYCWNKKEIFNNIIKEKYTAPRGHSCLFMNKKLIIFGGVVLFKKFYNEMFVINTDNFTMEQIFYDGYVPEIAFHSAEIINNNFFVIHGGLNKNYNVINDFYVFDIENKKFNKIEIPLIPKLFGHKILNVNNSCLNDEDEKDDKIFFVGGVDNFKFVGDENMINEEENKNINEDVEGKNEGNKQYEPMKMIMEIDFNI